MWFRYALACCLITATFAAETSPSPVNSDKVSGSQTKQHDREHTLIGRTLSRASDKLKNAIENHSIPLNGDKLLASLSAKSKNATTASSSSSSDESGSLRSKLRSKIRDRLSSHKASSSLLGDVRHAAISGARESALNVIKERLINAPKRVTGVIAEKADEAREAAKSRLSRLLERYDSVIRSRFQRKGGEKSENNPDKKLAEPKKLLD